MPSSSAKVRSSIARDRSKTISAPKAASHFRTGIVIVCIVRRSGRAGQSRRATSISLRYLPGREGERNAKTRMIHRQSLLEPGERNGEDLMKSIVIAAGVLLAATALSPAPAAAAGRLQSRRGRRGGRPFKRPHRGIGGPAARPVWPRKEDK